MNGELVWSFVCEFSFACACEHRLQEALTEEQRGGRRSRAASSVRACGSHPAQVASQFPPCLCLLLRVL